MLLNHFSSNIIIVILNGLIPSETVSNVLAGTKHFFLCVCSVFSVTINVSWYARAFWKTALHSKCWHIAVNVCSFSSREGTVTFVFCAHLFLFISFCSDITVCILNNRKTTSVLSQRYPCCVGFCHTYAKKSLLPLLFFFCAQPYVQFCPMQEGPCKFK